MESGFIETLYPQCLPHKADKLLLKDLFFMRKLLAHPFLLCYNMPISLSGA